MPEIHLRLDYFGVSLLDVIVYGGSIIESLLICFQLWYLYMYIRSQVLRPVRGLDSIVTAKMIVTSQVILV